jgi:hypothetical protein
MTRIIQICASRNDLFGLDETGAVYRYNFNTKGWAVLPSGSPGNTASPPDDAVESGHGEGAEPGMPAWEADR